MFSLDLCLEEILRLYKQAPKLICQPKRFLPVSAVFENPKSVIDVRLQLYSYFTITNLVRNLAVLLSNKQTCRNTSIIIPVYSLILELSVHNHGLIYLSNSNSINKLLRSLNNTNVILAYKLKTLAILDELKSSNDIDNMLTIDNLHLLYTLTINEHVRKTPILQVLTYGQNLSVLIDILIQKSIYKKKSPSRGYIIDLILSIVRTSSDIEYLKRYAGKLSELSKGEFSEIKEVSDWLKPCLHNDAFSYDNITPLYDFVKNNVDVCTSIPGELIMAFRILKYLGVGPYDHEHLPLSYYPDCRELKYKYVILQVYSLGGLNDCTNILNKLCDKFDPVIGGCQPGKRSEVFFTFVQIVTFIYAVHVGSLLFRMNL